MFLKLIYLKIQLFPVSKQLLTCWLMSGMNGLERIPCLCPTFLRTKATKRTKPPHTGDSKSCQYGDKAPLKPHISRGRGNRGLLWLVHYALFIQNSNQMASRLTVTTSFPRVFFSTPVIFKATSKPFGSQGCSDDKNWQHFLQDL